MSVATSPSWKAAPQPRSSLQVAADIFDPPPGTLDDLRAAEACAASLPRYIREVWPLVEPATQFVAAWHIDVVAEHLEAVTAGDIRRLIINIPPRAMKSLSTAVFWPSWEWLTAPERRWLFASYAASLSQRDSLKMRRVIRSQGGRDDGTIFQRLGYQGVLRLLHDQGGLEGAPWQLEKDQDAKNRYDTTATGFRIATSVGAMATGEGGDRIVVDDPVNAEQARSDADRDAANTWWDETMTTRFNNDRAAAVIVMQRLHETDLTGHLLEKGGWHHLCLPAEYEPQHPFIYPATVKLPSGRVMHGDGRVEEGELLDPVRLGPARLAELLRDLGSYAYGGQIRQLPAPLEGGMFRRHWWQRWQPGDHHELARTWDTVICSWDLRSANHAKAGTSYVVGQVWGAHGPDRYLLGQIRARLSFTETVKAVKALKAWRPDSGAILIEDKANGPAVMNTLRHKVPGLIPVSPDGGKDVRAAAVEPFVESGNVYLPAGEFIPCPPSIPASPDGPAVEFAPTRVADFIEEAAVFPNGANDDQVDTMTQALNWLRDRAAGKVISDDHAPRRDDWDGPSSDFNPLTESW